MVARATLIVVFFLVIGSVAATDFEHPVYESFSTTASSVTSAQLEFVVNTSWIHEHGLSYEEVSLYRQEATGWTALPTSVAHSSSETVTFRATTDGFSSFIIAANPQELAPDTQEPSSIQVPEQATLVAFGVFLVVLSVVISMYFVGSTQQTQPKNSYITSIKAIDPAKRRFDVCMQEFEKKMQQHEYSLASSLYHVARSAYLEASVHEDPFWVAVAHKHLSDAYHLLEKRYV